MNISQLVQASTLANGSATGSGASKATAGTASSKAASPLDKANSRIQSQLDSTSAQLSAFGKLKSAVSGLQLAGKALAATSASSPVASVRSATSELVDSFNASVILAQRSAALPGASVAEGASARRLTRELGQAFAGNTASTDALKKLGFKLESDGTLTLDAKKFDAALAANPAAAQASVAKLAQQLEKSASTELAADSRVNDAIAKLSQRSNTLKSQQSAMQTLAQQLAGSAGNSRLGLAAYLSNSG